MNALTVTTTSALAVTAAAIRTEHAAAHLCASEAVAHAIRAGELLIEAKAALPHGAFGPWLAANVEFSGRTARGYMRLVGMDEAKRQRVANLSLRDALAEIAGPRTPKAESPAFLNETDDQMRERCRAKLMRWLDSGLRADDVFRFTPQDTSPQEARDWIKTLSPAAYFDKDPEDCGPWDLEACADAFKTQRYQFLDTYVGLHAIANNELPPLGLIARDVEIHAARMLGRILNAWDKSGGWDPDTYLLRAKEKAAQTRAYAAEMRAEARP